MTQAPRRAARIAAALCLLSLAGAGALTGTARAAPYELANGIGLSVGLAPAGATPFLLDDLDIVATGSAGFTIADGPTVTPTAGSLSGVVHGSGDLYASPFGAAATRNYLLAQAGSGTVTLDFADPQVVFKLLWGSVDASPTGSAWNQLAFATSAGVLTVTGTDVGAALAAEYGSFTTGTETAWVQVALPIGTNFTTVTASDSVQPAFEFVPARPAAPPTRPAGLAAQDPPTDVPEPNSLALLATALAALGLARRAGP